MTKSYVVSYNSMHIKYASHCLQNCLFIIKICLLKSLNYAQHIRQVQDFKNIKIHNIMNKTKNI